MSDHRRGPFPTLDGYRALGMLLIMFFHVAYASGIWVRHPQLGRFTAHLDVGLPVFFVLSGFLLFRPFARNLLGDADPPGSGSYLRRRALRIIPGYWAAVVGITVFLGLPHAGNGAAPGGWGAVRWFLADLTLLPTLSASKGFLGFTQAWSIGVEVSFYVLLPLWALAMRRTTRGRSAVERRRLLLWACVGLWAVAQLWRVCLVAAQPSWLPSAALWLPSHLDFFAVGMVFATWESGDGAGLALPRWLEKLGDLPALCWGVGVTAWLVAVNPGGVLGPLGHVLDRPSDPLSFHAEYVFRQLLYGVAAAAVVLPGCFGPQDRGMSRRVLASRLAVGAGTISYGFYLWHLAWLQQGERWMDVRFFDGSFVKLAGVSLAGGLLCGTASYWLVERPFLRMKDRSPRRVRRDPTTPQAALR